MFEFRFFDEKDVAKNIGDAEPSNEKEWFEAKEISPEPYLIKEILESDCINSFTHADKTIKYISANLEEVFREKLISYPIFKAKNDDSDLVTGVYEGGLKIWECTWDLIRYICDKNVDIKSKRVLDLGCGTGLLGILAFLYDSQVYFQDYNEEIIKYVTVPNVFVNSEDNKIETNCKFYSGDWSSFLDINKSVFDCESTKFDYIFTSETIYNTSNYKKLQEVFKRCLKKDGIVFLAAKSHYFGVGGGTKHFEEFLKIENLFNVYTCWKSTNGLQREILKITFKV